MNPPRHEPTLDGVPDVEQRLEQAHSQLALFARDLRKIVDAERKKNRELEEANARLLILDRLKSDFLTFISHELRTPLSNLSAVSLLEVESSTEGRRQLIEIVRAGYDRLEGLVSRGLEYFQLLAAKGAATGESCEVEGVIREAMAMTPEVAGRKVRLAWGQAGTTVRVRGRRDHLVATIHSLLDNAVRFSRDGSTIGITVDPSSDPVRIEVADQGDGFPPEMAGEILRPFTVTNLMNHSRGTGLSLALAAARMQAHGGSLEATSPGPGKGASFVVKVPRHPSGTS